MTYDILSLGLSFDLSRPPPALGFKSAGMWPHTSALNLRARDVVPDLKDIVPNQVCG